MENITAYIRKDDPELEAQLARTASVNDLLDRWAASQPGRIAISAPSGLSTWRRISYPVLRSESMSIAAGLYSAGVRPGDHVGILADANAYAECLIAYFALLRIGAVMTPISPRYADDEIAYTVGYSDCSALIAHPDFTNRIDALRGRLPGLKTLVSIGASPEGWTGWQALFEAAPPIQDWPRQDKNHAANIIFTSGTTARPKGVMHTHGSALATGAIFSAALGLRNEDVFHHAVPFFTSSGAQFTLMAALWAGSTMVVEPRFDAAAVLQRIQDEGTNMFLGVPSHYLFLLDELRRLPRALPSVRVWDYGGAPMPTAAVRELARYFPGVEQRQQYGMTETGPSGTILTLDSRLERMESVGRPMPLCEVRVVDPAGNVVAHGENGEICLRSAACMTGYYRNAEATAKTLVDGWVHTGDLGWMDADGYLYYSDRVKDIINRGGLKISSMEIEEILYRHPDVLEAAVIAIPHARLGEDIMAFVVPKPGTTIDIMELKALCVQHLADYKAPRRLVVLDSLPRNTMGKVQKTMLRALQEKHSPALDRG